jgi:hypothetical protein
VTYKTTPGIDFLVPGEMREIYLVRQTETRIDGKATYDKFRQFSVVTTEKPKPDDFGLLISDCGSIVDCRLWD